MTITISSNNTSTIDRILRLLRREKVPFAFHPEPTDTLDDVPSKAQVLEDLRLSLIEAKRDADMGIRGQSLIEFLDEYEAEINAEKTLEHAY